jgi:hypothetical protein
MRVWARVVRETSCLVLLARGAPGVVGEHSLVRAIQFARFEEKRTTGKSPFRLVAWVVKMGLFFEPCLAPRVVRVRLMLVGLRVVF